MSAAHSPRARIAAAVIAVAAGTLAACTSDGDGGPTSAPPTTSTAPATRPSGTPAATSPTGSPAVGLAGLDGTLLVAGPTRANADLYRIVSGRVARLTRSADVTAVGSGGGRIVLGVREPDGGDGTEAVRELRGTTLIALRGGGFDPAVSGSGAVATVRVDGGSGTRGISKPSGFALSVRATVSAADRTVLRTRQSMGSPRWIDDHTLVVAIAAGDDAQVSRIDTRTGRRTDLGRIAGGGDLEITASTRAVTVATDNGAVALTTVDRRQIPFPRGWTPLCWPAPTTALATNAGRLGTVSLSANSTLGPPRVLGPLPAGTSAYAASCG